jgi:subtilisin family serine protease
MMRRDRGARITKVRQRALLALLLIAALGTRAPAAPPPLPEGAHGPRIIVAFANASHGAPAPAGTTGNRYSGAEGYRLAQSAQREAQRVAETYALRSLTSWPIAVLAVHCVVYEIPDNRDMAEVLAALSKDSHVVLAQPLQEFHTLGDTRSGGAPYNDPLYDLQTNLVTLGVARAHERTQGAGLKVALIDTAVDLAHPDLRGRIVRAHSFVPAHAPAFASVRHGTAMAGLIAAVANNHIGIVGIAPLAQLEVFEACWQLQADSDAAACNTFTLAQALAAALDSGAPLVNLSIAGPKDPLLALLIERGVKRGITFVGALAGTDAGFPTSVAGVIAAGGTEHALPAGAFAAPSEHVLTLRPQGQYDFTSGTSVAAAELTGLIALLMSASPTRLTPGAVTALLQAGAPAASATASGTAAVDVNAALARLDAGQHRATVGVRGTLATPHDLTPCAPLPMLTAACQRAPRPSPGA